jgi:hypothetical protein
VKTCVEFVFFEIFGSSWYNTWTIVLIAWLWLVSSVDATQAHIHYIYSHPNLSQIKFLANLLAGLRGSGNFRKFPGDFRFPENSGPGPECPDLWGINTLFTTVVPFSFLYHFDWPPPSPVALPLAFSSPPW